MADLTPKFNLRRPAGIDAVQVQLDLSDNMTKIDAALGNKTRFAYTAGGGGVVAVVSTTAFSSLPGVPILSLKATIGDWVEVGGNGLMSAEAPSLYLDAWSKPVGTLLYSWAGNSSIAPVVGHQGVPAWRGEPGRIDKISGSTMRQVTAPDLSVTNMLNIVFSGRISGGASKSIYASPTIPLEFWAINHGQP